jgi:hypothetical protein
LTPAALSKYNVASESRAIQLECRSLFHFRQFDAAFCEPTLDESNNKRAT